MRATSLRADWPEAIDSLLTVFVAEPDRVAAREWLKRAPLHPSTQSNGSSFVQLDTLIYSATVE